MCLYIFVHEHVFVFFSCGCTQACLQACRLCRLVCTSAMYGDMCVACMHVSFVLEKKNGYYTGFVTSASSPRVVE